MFSIRAPKKYATWENSIKESLNQVEVTKFPIRLNSPFAQRLLNKDLIQSKFDSSVLIDKWKSLESQEKYQELQKLVDWQVTFEFMKSIVLDLVSWGVDIEIHDSTIYFVKNPNKINDSMHQNIIRNALTNLKIDRKQFDSNLSDKEALEMLKYGEIELVKVTPEQKDLSEVFRHGVATWSMPYRGREGRSTRFVLLIKFKDRTVPIGIMETGDDAPFSPLRDKELGFTKLTLSESRAQELILRFKYLRNCLKKTDLPIDPQDELVKIVDWFDNNKENIKNLNHDLIAKRMNYLQRIIKAEYALSVGHREMTDELGAGLRAIKDVTLNRVHTEVVICGALPPFGNFLVGKLVASMMNHPYVRKTLDRDIGILLGESFEIEKLEKWLPRFGPLLVTTKGLFSGHSAQYNRVRTPSPSGDLKLIKLGETEGTTMSHISDRSMELAVAINSKLGSRSISRDYGSGGAKRQRILQRALTEIGIPVESVFANIKRPVYGLKLVKNAQDVVIFGHAPVWIDDFTVTASPKDYDQLALSRWRDRWFNTALRRSKEEIESV